MSPRARLSRRALVADGLRALAGLAAVRALAGCGGAAPRAARTASRRGAGLAPAQGAVAPGAMLESELRGGTLMLRWSAPRGAAPARHPGEIAAVVAVDALTQRPRLGLLGASPRAAAVTLGGPSDGAPGYVARVDVATLLNLDPTRTWFVHASYLQHRSAVYVLRPGA